VVAINPQASMIAIKNDELQEIAGNIKEKLEKVIQSI